MKRNLYFRAYPLSGREMWSWQIENLRRYIDVFNGRKLIVIALDGTTEPADSVRSKFNLPDAEYIEVENDPVLMETSTFVTGLDRLRSLDPNEITFYAHTKGISYGPSRCKNIKTLSEIMYSMNLGRIDITERILGRYAAAGTYRRIQPHGGSSWHYPGTFFWFKHSELFSRNWRKIHPTRFGVEGYLGLHFSCKETYDLGPLGFEKTNLYRSIDESAAKARMKELVKEWA